LYQSPRFIAPWHPRLDHAIFYEPFGSSGTFTSILSHNNPYAWWSSATAYTALQLRLLAGGADAAAVAPLLRGDPFAGGAPPRAVRVLACQFVPASLAHWWRSGEWWVETVMGTAYPALSLRSLRAAQLDPRAPLPAAGPPLWPLPGGGASPSAQVRAKTAFVRPVDHVARAGEACGRGGPAPSPRQRATRV
jgi:hypothetical protein